MARRDARPTDPEPLAAEIEGHSPPPRAVGASDPGWLRAVARISTWANRIAAFVAAVMLVGMTGLILVEIGMRFFSRSTFMADVLVGYGVAAITFLAAAWALEEGAMIRVTVLTDRMPAGLRRLAEGFTLISVGGITWFLLSYQWATVARLFGRGSLSQHFVPIPLWIPETFFLVGLFLILFQVAVRFLRLIAVGHAVESALKL